MLRSDEEYNLEEVDSTPSMNIFGKHLHKLKSTTTLAYEEYSFDLTDATLTESDGDQLNSGEETYFIGGVFLLVVLIIFVILIGGVYVRFFAIKRRSASKTRAEKVEADTELLEAGTTDKT